MKIIAIEEHFQNRKIKEAMEKWSPDVLSAQNELASNPPNAQLEDIGAGRLLAMDAMGVDVQVLSYISPGVHTLPASEAVPLAKDANDQLAAAIGSHPDRFAGFATLPTPHPEEAATELERAVQQLGFKGAMIHGRTGDRFLDDPQFRPILEAAVVLDVPLYLHPTVPSKVAQDAYYAGFDPLG
jgi:predicted TIM-barrel fold metal-dependent hydrolase